MIEAYIRGQIFKYDQIFATNGCYSWTRSLLRWIMGKTRKYGIRSEALRKGARLIETVKYKRADYVGTIT